LSINAEHGTASKYKSRAIPSLFKGAHERIDWPLRGSFSVLCARGQQVVTQSWLSRLSQKKLEVPSLHRVEVLSRRRPKTYLRCVVQASHAIMVSILLDCYNSYRSAWGRASLPLHHEASSRNERFCKR
jgi:hypothetical protein